MAETENAWSMAQFQRQRRAELEAFARGDHRFSPPATGILVNGRPLRLHEWTDAHMNLTRSVADTDRGRR